MYFSTSPFIPMPEFSPISLGCVTFGREIDQAAAFALMDHAVTRGVRFFDTAAAYAQGASERIVGAWLASQGAAAKSVTVATKLLPPYTPEAIARSVQQSRERLGVPIIDLLLVHRWDASIEDAAALCALDDLRQKHVIRALGVSNFTTPQLEQSLFLQATIGLQPFQVIQNNQNLAVRDVDEAMRDLCAKHKIAITTYSPLGAGFLTGKHQNGAVAGSRFAIIPGHQSVYFHERSYKRLAHLQKVAARTGHSPTRLALAWALHQPGTASVLIGGRTTAHLDQAFDALNLNDAELFAELSRDA